MQEGYDVSATSHTDSVIVPQIEGEFVSLVWCELLEDHLRREWLEQSLVNAQGKILTIGRGREREERQKGKERGWKIKWCNE